MISSEAEARGWLRTLPEVGDVVMARLERLAAMLITENDRQNLVSSASLIDVWQRHIADSAQLLNFVPRETCSPWLDLGTGAGFPGLVIAALRPECTVIMVESRTLRSDWLERASTELALHNAVIARVPVERVETQPMGVISARAFAQLGRLLKLSARFSTDDTVWLLPKGRSARQELQSLHGWNHLFHVEQSLTDKDAGIITGRLLGRKGR